MKPVHDFVLIRPEKEAEKSAGGIYMPESVTNRERAEGEVVARGPGRRDERGNLVEPSCNVGDTVLYSSYAGSAIDIGGTSYRMVQDHEIVALIGGPVSVAEKEAVSA